jgi:ABC-type nitrate/sulfonate/bicarbonate transport system substrate-binding protein
MTDHPDTWARMIEMARARLPATSPRRKHSWDTYDVEETAVYVVAQDVEDEQQAILEAARGAAQLCSELRGEAASSASAAAGQSAEEVARAANAEVLHAFNGKAPDEVDDDDYADFDEDEGAPDPADKQRSLMASFETARRDRAVQQFMVAELQAHQEVRDMW